MAPLFALALSYYIWDLATEPATFMVWGADYHDGIGHNSLAAADFNGDGIDDLIIPTPVGDGPGNTRPSCGDIYIIFGRPGLSGTWDMASQPPDLAIYGPVQGWAMGYAIATGDVNNDGFDDILVSDLERHAYLIYGSDTLTGIRDLAVDSADYFVDATGYALNYFGEYLELVDVNNDTLPDLVFSDRCHDYYFRQGRVDIIFNDGNLTGNRVFTVDPPDALIWGPGACSDFGLFRGIRKGDANSDGKQDLFIALRYNDSAYPTRGYIIYQVNPGNNYLEGCAGYKVYPDVREGKPFGLNPEAYPDLALRRYNAVGIYGHSPSPFYGGRDLETQPPDFQILGVGYATNSWEVMDFNLDSWAEIIGGYPDDNKVQVFSLWPHPTGEWDPDVDTADVVILNDVSGAYLGRQIAVGDFNGDGYPDLQVSESYENGTGGQQWAGAVYVFDLHSLIDTSPFTPFQSLDSQLIP